MTRVHLHPSAFMLSFHKVPFPCFVLHYWLIFILSFFSLSFSSIVSLEDIRLEFFHVRFYYVCGHLGYFSKLMSFVGSPLPIFRVLWLPWVKLLPSFHRVRVHNAHITLNHQFIFFFFFFFCILILSLLGWC